MRRELAELILAHCKSMDLQGKEKWDGVHPEELPILNGKRVSEDEYYEKLGELVEQDPVTVGRVRRG